ncbi:hypothetical protein ADUPG1_009946, partial [Aduncisulcus paluster]
GHECGNYDGTDNNPCDSETHTCTCSSSSSSPLMTGDLCEIESGVTLLSSLGMDVTLVEAICESMHVADYDVTAVQSLCSSSSAENILSSLTVDDLSTITSLTIPTTVASLSGLEYAEHLEILSFAPGNTLISDLSPIASLSSLYVIELDSLENMDVSLLSTLTDAVGALKMDLESDTSRWNGTSESYCVGLCSLRKLRISGLDNDLSVDSSSHSTFDSFVKVEASSFILDSSFTSLLNNIAMCSGQCVSSYDDGTKVYPLSSILTHLDLSFNDISDPTIVSLQPGLSGVTHLTLSDNSISDLALLQQTIDGLGNVTYVDVSDNRLDCGSTVSECTELLNNICDRDLYDTSSFSAVDFGSGDVLGSVSQDTTSACGSDSSSSSSSSSSSCSYLEDHRVCGVDHSFSVDNDDDTELACICGSGYYEDISSGECVLASSSSSSECSNCGGQRGTCVYDSDSDSSDESSPLFCECSDGWYGTDCSSICPVSDDLGLCSGSSHGICDAATHTCVCESGYYGSACNLYCDSLSKCGLHGRCAVGDLFSDYSSETLYCECDAGWYGSSCSSQYPVETVEYVNDDDETNPTIVDYVCGVNYSTDPSSSYSAYGIYSSDTDTYSCNCSSYGLITDASTSTCIDPATHPEYKDIAGNDTACLTCGTTTDSHGTCVLGEGEDSLISAMCQCEYGWGNDSSTVSSSASSCSVDMCGVSEDTYTESNADPSTLCSSHGVCYLSSSSSSSSFMSYDCSCDGGWYGYLCGQETSFWSIQIIVILILSIVILTLSVCMVYHICYRNGKMKSMEDLANTTNIENSSSRNVLSHSMDISIPMSSPPSVSLHTNADDSTIDIVDHALPLSGEKKTVDVSCADLGVGVSIGKEKEGEEDHYDPKPKKMVVRRKVSRAKRGCKITPKTTLEPMSLKANSTEADAESKTETSGTTAVSFDIPPSVTSVSVKRKKKKRRIVKKIVIDNPEQ